MEEEENEGVISVREFFAKWDDSALSMYNTPTQISEEGQQTFPAFSLSLQAETIEELSKACGVDLLWCGDEPIDKKLLLNNIPDDTGLQTLDYQKMAVRKKAAGKPVPRKINPKRVDSYMWLPPRPEGLEDQVPPEYRVPSDDVVMVVHVFKVSGAVPNHRVLRDQTFLVRGCMPLITLRDAIKCVNDHTVAGDISHNPRDKSQLLAKDLYRSAMFFIHKTFYNDLREYDNLDYSKEIREWLESQDGEKLPSVDMANACFQDLQLQLGTHYLYQHQGDCEHMIVFSDLRLIHPSDPQDIRQYPFLLQRAMPRRTVCRACSTHTASFQVFDSEYAPENPCYMCQGCFLAFHYDEEDRKIGTFRAYKHVDSSML